MQQQDAQLGEGETARARWARASWLGTQALRSPRSTCCSHARVVRITCSRPLCSASSASTSASGPSSWHRWRLGCASGRPSSACLVLTSLGIAGLATHWPSRP